MIVRNTRHAYVLSLLAFLSACGAESPQTPGQNTTAPKPPAASAARDDAEPDDGLRAPAVRTAAALAALVPSNAMGCAPGARCIRVDPTGQPQAAGTSIAQCRGEFADFIVPANTIPAGYSGPWFTPRLIESAHTGVPQGTRPWRQFDPRIVNQRLPYLLSLRNYAFASDEVRSLTPQLTSDTDYFDTAGGTVPANQRSQSWYPAPRMIYTNPGSPREPARGMTLERTVIAGELGGNTAAFRNYAVAYYDARGARTYARVWSTATPGLDTPNRANMRITAGGFVFKLLYSAARPSDFPQDLLAGSLALDILPNANGTRVNVRLLQIDIAVKDDRAGATGWYFATYAFDRTVAGTSPWLKMAPLGLMWGNDPMGPPIVESWINQSAPAYAKDHLGVDGRLNGPVDNRVSACLSCHGTAQAPSLASMIPPPDGSCAPMRASWFRNLPGTQAFGRFDPRPSVCETSVTGLTQTAADYSLQLGATVTRALGTVPSFNPCTFDDASPPPLTPPPPAAIAGGAPRVFEVTRDPTR